MKPLLIDISKWQDNDGTPQKMNLKLAAERGVAGVYIKASQYVIDPDFKDNMANAEEAGLLRGAYHFANYDRTKSGAKDAEFFWSIIKDDPGELPPALDFETRDGIGLSWIKQFLETIKSLSGKTPVLYTGINVWDILKDSTNAVWVLEYPLWISNPNNNLTAPVRGIPEVIQNGNPNKPNIWTRKNHPWTIWQFSYVGDGPYYGAESKGLDMNVFNGDMSDLMAFAGIGEVDPVDPQEPSDQYIRVIARKKDGQPGWLMFRDEASFEYPEVLAVGYGVTLKLLDPEPINGLWHIETARGRIGFVSAGKAYTIRV